MLRRTFGVVGATVIALFLGTALYAQQDLGIVTGTVRDPSGAVVPGAEVIAQRAETGVETKVLSGADGIYTVPALHVGTYALRVAAAGFKTSAFCAGTPSRLICAAKLWPCG